MFCCNFKGGSKNFLDYQVFLLHCLIQIGQATSSALHIRHGHRSKKFLAATYMKQCDVKSTKNTEN